MPTKFYLRDAQNSLTGTLPGATSLGTSVNINNLSVGTTAGKTLQTTIGSGQTSVSSTTSASIAGQNACFCSFYSDPIAAQTIASQTITCVMAGLESSTNSNFLMSWVLAVWRPSTGASVGLIWDKAAGTAEVGTSQTVGSLGTGGTSTSRTALDGDILVLELFRFTQAQSMATSYTNTHFFDGTTESSTTNHAATLTFTNNITMFSAPATKAPPPPNTTRRMRHHLTR